MSAKTYLWAVFGFMVVGFGSVMLLNYQPRRKAPSFSYGDIRLAPAWLC
ncbi:hypothetical protein [Helicobacter bizzozeronii]|uniref:OMP1859 n=1 Tax=Helicobacter bizzozeronii TaxID=56877 RepID=A0A1M4NH18_HELBI|nr:hypothetical protein [Helicobacter bizzozeronii]SFZ71642.1 OMP1859 [Helicobacter bizzozeronii]